MDQTYTRLSTWRPLFVSRVKLKVTLTYFVMSVVSHVTRWYRQSRELLVKLMSTMIVS